MADHDADRLLVAQVRKGDPRAWEELIGRYEGRLFAFVDSRIGDRAASEDIVQETFLGFLTSLPNYDERTPLESFLFAIAAHKLTDFLRREGRRPTVSLPAASRSGVAGEIAGDARTASSILRSREGHRRDEQVLSECLARLIRQWLERKEFERLKCIELLFVLGWTNKAVARTLGLSEQAVANHKHFVLSKLKETARRARLDNADWSAWC